MADTFLTEALLTEKKKHSPPPMESEADKKKRQWDHILEKILFAPSSEEYYAKWPLRPGIYFYKALALAK